MRTEEHGHEPGSPGPGLCGRLGTKEKDDPGGIGTRATAPWGIGGLAEGGGMLAVSAAVSVVALVALVIWLGAETDDERKAMGR